MKDEKRLTVKDILKRPIFSQAKLLAGKQGINRKIEWVHIIDITSAAAYTNRNNLILTTGVGFYKKATNRKKYMLELIEKNASGLCVELSEHLPEITQDMIELANQYQFPIIVFNHPIRFVEITQDLHSLLINQKFQVLNELEFFSHQIQQLTLKSTDISSILRLFHDYTSNQVVYYSLYEKDHFSPPVSTEMAENIKKKFKLLLDEQPSLNESPIVAEINQKKWILLQPIICLGQTPAYIGVILHKKEATESVYLNRLLDYVCKAVGYILLRKMYLLEKTKEDQNVLIQDILDSKITNEEQARARIGLDSKANENIYIISGVIDIKHNLATKGFEEIELKNQEITVLLRSILKKNGIYSLLKLQNNQLYLLGVQESLFISSANKMKSCIHKAVKQLEKYVDHSFKNNVSITAGFGQVKDRMIDSHKGFKEALDTVDVVRLIPHASPFYDELGIFQLLKGISDKKLLNSFISDNLGSVLLYDKENNSNLLETLDEYLKCMGAKQETAERLYIHRQTLYHRLEKLEGLLGQDFLKPEKRMCLELALRALDIVRKAN